MADKDVLKGFSDRWTVCSWCKGTGQSPSSSVKNKPHVNMCAYCKGEPYVRRQEKVK